ncbi:MAG: 3-oxoadipate enol-lactonase [Neisseria sp.]|nr:3-oxoadipate enol-lactonase [Neisseria sp.]
MAYAAGPRGRLFYQTYGDPARPALIFSNSLGTDHSMWQPQINALQDDFYLIAYDSRGHGQSEVPQGSYTLADLGADVIDVLNAAAVERAHFCGISMGGLTGQWLGIHAPQRFDKLIISNTAAKIGNTEAWQQRADSVRQQGLADIAASAASRWFTDGFTVARPQTVADLSGKLAAQSPAGYAACCEALAAADLRGEVSQIGVPTLIIGGRADPVTTVADAEWLQTQIAGAQLTLLDASHIANIEADAGFTQVLRRFLTA